MKMRIADYEVRPGVVPSGERVRVRIIPRGRHASFDDQIHKGSPILCTSMPSTLAAPPA